jgi:nucleoside-diphosphate-sugar epimerase
MCVCVFSTTEMSDAAGSAPLVLVTGVSGYIGSWVAHAALKLGYRVRGTVRSLANESKVQHLRDLCPGSSFMIELVEADLNSDKGWAEAVAGCTFVLHVASPFPLQNPRDKEELIRPAVDGTLFVLRAVAAANPRPKRVVVTSSFVAIGYGQRSDANHPFTEDNWTVIGDPNMPTDAYAESKTLAEKAAWDFHKSLPEDDRFELCTVNPVLVQGPMLSANNCSSADLPRQILLAEMPALVDMDLFVTHIYDVTKAHLLAMVHPQAANQRFLLCGSVLSFPEYATVLRTEFAQYGYRCTSFVAPKPIVWLSSLWDKQAASVYPSLGMRVFIAGKNAKQILGMDVRTDPTGTRNEPSRHLTLSFPSPVSFSLSLPPPFSVSPSHLCRDHPGHDPRRYRQWSDSGSLCQPDSLLLLCETRAGPLGGAHCTGGREPRTLTSLPLDA